MSPATDPCERPVAMSARARRVHGRVRATTQAPIRARGEPDVSSRAPGSAAELIGPRCPTCGSYSAARPETTRTRAGSSPLRDAAAGVRSRSDDAIDARWRKATLGMHGRGSEPRQRHFGPLPNLELEELLRKCENAPAWRFSHTDHFFRQTFAITFFCESESANSLGNWRAREVSNLRPSA